MVESFFTPVLNFQNLFTFVFPIWIMTHPVNTILPLHDSCGVCVTTR